MSNSNEDHSYLLAAWDRGCIAQWIKEDVPSFDWAGFVVGSKEDEATLFCKSTGVLSGRFFFEEIFSFLNCTVQWFRKEGEEIFVENKSRVAIATVKGAANNILLGERTALNLLARASGIASRARKIKQIAQAHNFKGVVAGTRKTTPGFRVVEKYALVVGGCDPHRMDLSSMIMLKDNHIWSNGSIQKTVVKAKGVGGFSLKIEVECQSKEEAIEAIKAGADIIMLDNFKPNLLKETALLLKQEFPNVLIEASGGIEMDTLPEYFDDCIDIISMGITTQSVPHVDFSLKIKH